MPRYMRQKNLYSCGPVAIVNALKWIGRKASYRSLKRFEKLCKCDVDGASEWDILRGIRKLGVDAHLTYTPSAGILDFILDNGNAAIVSYYYAYKKEKYGHFVFVSRRTKKRYVVHNDNNKSTLMVPRRRFLRMLATGTSCAIVVPGAT